MKTKRHLLHISLVLILGMTAFSLSKGECFAFACKSSHSGDYGSRRGIPSWDNAPIAESVTFSIKKNTYDYTGKAITPEVSVQGRTDTGTTIILNKGVDYDVQYEDNVTYGVGRIIISGKGSYRGYHILKFGILPEKVSGVQVKSPFYMENTVTWKKAKGADGYYIYRKAAGEKDYAFVANVTDANFQVFHDKSKRLKKNKRYHYKVVSYVADPYYDEEVEGSMYSKPQKNKGWGDFYFHSPYKNDASYYSNFDNDYYHWYNYSAIKGKCVSAFESTRYATGSGKVTAKKTHQRYAIYTRNATIDYMAYLTNKKIVGKGMSDNRRVQAIYNWMVKNCTFTKDIQSSAKRKKMKCYIKYASASVKKKAQAYEKKIMRQIYQGKALCIGDNWRCCEQAQMTLAYRKGSCAFLTPMFNILCGQAGVETYIVSGEYINRDKSRAYHNWSFAKLGKKYYWFDVAVACINKKSASSWYRKGTKYWKTCHSWSKGDTKGYREAVFQK